MATQVKHRRGTQSEIDNFTPAIAEIVVNTTESELVLGDGATQGGVPVAKKYNTTLKFDTLALAKVNTSLKVGHSLLLKERSTGKKGGGVWDVVASGTYPVSSYVVDHDTLPLQLVLNVEHTMDIRSFGGDTAAADNSTFIADAISHPELKVLTGGPGVYNYTSDVNVVGSDITFHDIKLNGVGARTILSGSLTDLGALTGGGIKGTKIVSVADASSLSEGDIVIIHNSADFSFSSHRANYQDGEFNRVDSISGNTITLSNILKGVSDYPVSSTVSLYKVNGISVNLHKATFTSDESVSYPLFVKHVVNSYQVASSVKGGSSGAMAFDKCYNVVLQGGEYICNSPAIGLNYGVAVINSQNIITVGGEAFGTRHACTTGGDSQPGAVPNRNIRFTKMQLSNGTDIYPADFHGNTVDSSYEECIVDGSIGLAGENVTAVGNRFLMGNTGNIPIQFQEIVGGKIGIYDNIVEMNDGATSVQIIAQGSTAIADDIDRDYFIDVDGLKVKINSSVTRILNLFHNAPSISHKWSMNNITIEGDDANLVYIIRATVSGSGQAPDSVSLTNLHYNAQGGQSYMTIGSGSFTGCMVTMPSNTISDDLTISSGDWYSQSGGTGNTGMLVFNYPDYPAAPQLISTVGPFTRGNEPYFAGVDQLSETQAQGFIHRADSSLTAPVNRTLRLTMEVNMDKVTL